MSFKYNKINAICSWCKRSINPHPSFSNETIPTKTFITHKGRHIELCFNCYENEKNYAKKNKIDFSQLLDQKFEIMKKLKL